MIQVDESIFVGNLLDCQTNREEFYVIHVCKNPCHQRAVGYQRSLIPNHPEYLIAERRNNLYLNMVDMDTEQDPKYINPMLKAAFKFIQVNEGKKILIHCNEGHSRAPSIALLYLAKISKKIPNKSYDEAKIEFTRKYKYFAPNDGILSYMHRRWNEIDSLVQPING